MNGARQTRLTNGLTVTTLAMPGLETAAIALNAGIGARHERADEHGLAHLFEHMLFKGTARRSARAIAEEIEDVGGSLNAWTSRDATAFHARILGADVALALDLIADLVTAPCFDEADLAKERDVVLSEIGESLDTPDDLVFDHLQETAFTAQSLGRAILGTPESLAALDRAALEAWRARYSGEGLVLAAAGAIDHDALVAQADRLLGGLPGAAPAAAEPARWTGGSKLQARRFEQTHLTLGFAAPGARDAGLPAAQIFACALGGGMSSRLFQELREVRGLAYSVSAHHGAHDDAGMLAIYAATQPGEAAAALDLARTIAHATAADLSPAEVARARAQLKAGLLMNLESPGGQAEWLGRSILLFGRVVPPAELIAALDAVSVDDAREAGARMLTGVPALAAVGPRAARLAA